MTFIGREKETRKIVRALEHGNNVIIKGKYGIGRTTLIKHIAESLKERYRFLFTDFSRMPAQICNDLLAYLFPQKKYRKEDLQYRRYKEMRFRIAHRALPDGRTHVIVLDNIGRITRQKMAFVRYIIWDKKFRFIAIVESNASEGDLILLRAALMPAEVMTLSYLSAESAGELLRHFAENHHFEWTETHIHHLVEVYKGYPLGLTETVDREIKRLREKAFQVRLNKDEARKSTLRDRNEFAS
jgi:replication-associated recombination protein RarA